MSPARENQDGEGTSVGSAATIATLGASYFAVAVIATVALSVMADLGSLLHCSYTAQSPCQGVPQTDEGPLIPSQCPGASKRTYPGCQSASHSL